MLVKIAQVCRTVHIIKAHVHIAGAGDGDMEHSASKQHRTDVVNEHSSTKKEQDVSVPQNISEY